jgi:uncharacterized protein (DUF1684 family)
MGDEARELGLADWRRRIAELYADVRRIAAIDPIAAHAVWRGVRETLYQQHPLSPVPAEARRAFEALHFEYDPAVRFEAAVEPEAPAAADGDALPLALPNSGAEVLSFRRIGSVQLPFPEGSRRLWVFWMEGYAGGLFLPFRDGTNGVETYSAGRYLLDGAKGADLGGDIERARLVLDFNFAFQPSCAFDPRWACPLAPPENRLDIQVRAGERVA